uniref:E3 ubiquitin-protein ligase MARCH2 n=1 Tax=Anthurium amnicola TaxID=1678845 RepID=A0A1D1Z719_9ARAE
MSDHLALSVDQLAKSEPVVDSVLVVDAPESSRGVGVADGPAALGPLPSTGVSVSEEQKVEIAICEEEEPLIQTVECRICQEEDNIKNLDTPCVCSGSLKYAHRACVQRWVNEKGDLTCEICHEPYRAGYLAPPPIIPDETTIDIDIGGGWAISGTPFTLHDPRILAMAAAHHHFLEAEYDEYAARNTSGTAFFRSAALILLALLLLRYALTITDSEGEDDASTIFSLFLLRAAGFLLPCYIMAWAISILQRRRQRQEAADLAAAELAFILQSSQTRGLQVAIEPESPASPQQEQHQ